MPTPYFSATGYQAQSYTDYESDAVWINGKLLPTGDRQVSPLPLPMAIVIHDGDTIKASFEGVPEILGHDLLIRLNGIDCPELHDPTPLIREFAYAAKAYLQNSIARGKETKLTNISRDKYFRLDAYVWVDGLDMQQVLLALKFAKPYFGGTKLPWTVADIPPKPWPLMPLTGNVTPSVGGGKVSG